ncbi:putative secreted protein [Wickerhamomyces ciferrii]|uniref:Secreted protein n=1 Tax=Wickerhamomyces ciferrii (strain ATCC 14091 / BCRC 22168 / CBS 111 / JCM 3599 / NBRC 0793 / NRRL Y-1031 F-60-10) TaxID=1206466 RepID=K0KYP7_WICCF|nr:uncharacterized protein BN7_6132 [Wickerhamomyces ciferrii]CCH46539.1 putative secreted protein [Wickerhamomyces ciferrii]
MKLSTIFLEGLLLAGVISSPISAEDSSLESNNSTSDIIKAEGNGAPKLCFNANKSPFCLGNHNVNDCISAYKLRTGMDKKEATQTCKFWCSEIKTPTQCKQCKYKADYHPDFACDDAKYC